jgi:phospholipase D1/2
MAHFPRHNVRIMGGENGHPTAQKRRIWIGIGILLLLFAVAAAWKWTPLADVIDVGRAARWAASLRESPARHFYVLGAYVIGSILLLPITLLILITAVVFGPLLGTVYSLIGCLAGALVTYAIGYFLGQDFVRKMAGSKWQRMERKIGETGIIAVATLRLLPVAPFSVVNIVSGAFKVRPRDYIVGSILGLLPGILITNLFAHQFQSAIRNPGAGTFLLLAVLVIITVAGSVWLKRRFETTG